MKIEYNEEKDMPVPINIDSVPNSIIVSQSTQNECFYNSYLVSKENKNIEIVEGVGVIISKDKLANAFPHVWNRVDGNYFDVTVQDPKDLNKNITDLKYLKVRSYLASEFKIGDNLKFCDETIRFVKELNEKIKQ